MKNLILILLCLTTSGLWSADQPAPKNDETKMAAASDKAHRKIAAFISALGRNDAEYYAVRCRFKKDDGSDSDPCWVSKVSYQDDQFTGTVDTEPEGVSAVKAGDSVTVAAADISDWMFIKDGKIHGGFTHRVQQEARTEAQKKMPATFVFAPEDADD